MRRCAGESKMQAFKKLWISYVTHPFAPNGKEPLLKNAAHGRQGWLSFLLHHLIY